MAGEHRFDFRDIPSCARLGLSARKVWIYFKALVLSWVVWDIFIYLGFLAAGEDMGARWDLSVLLPLPGGLYWSSWLAVCFLVVAVLLVLRILLGASLGVSRLTFQQLRGDGFCSGTRAKDFSSSHGAPLGMVPFLLVAAVLLGLACGWCSGLISRIPAAGPVISAVLTVPLWGVMLLVVLTCLAFVLSFMLLPAIVASTRGDSFESVFELFSTMTSQPWRVFVYWLISLVFIVLGGAVFLFFSSSAAALLAWTTGIGAGNAGLGAAMASGPRMLAPELLPFFSGLAAPASAAGQAWTGVAGTIAGASGTAVFLVFVSYLLSCCSSAWTMIYLGLRKRRDGVDLLDEADIRDDRDHQRLYGDEAPVSGTDGTVEG